MIDKWDPINKEHLGRIERNEIHYRYLSSKIHNELIISLVNEIKNVKIRKLKEAKYYVILDCTLDASHREKMSLILIYVDVSSNPIPVQEYFLELYK